MLIKNMPRSTATNVYDLLQDVKAAIREEPRRMNMEYPATDGPVMWFNDKNSKTEMIERPSCGTVGCFAGWAQMLAGASVAVAAKGWQNRLTEDLLGHDLTYFFQDAEHRTHHFFNSGDGDGIRKMRPGTREYARAVCRRVNRFIEVNGGKAALKARALNLAVLQ